MSRSAKSVFIYGLFYSLTGLMLLLAPNLLLEAFGIEKTNEVWIRIDGVLMLAISIYYMITAKHEFTALIKATAYIRLTIINFYTAFVSLKMVSRSILIIGIIDFIGGMWTILMLKKEGHFFCRQVKLSFDS